MFNFGMGLNPKFGMGATNPRLTDRTSVFVSDWDTENTSAGSSITSKVALPLIATGTYNFVVNWGDGNEDTITTWNQAEATHTYAATGTYRIRITGIVSGWQFNNTLDKLKILDILSWGPLAFGAVTGHFYGCTNLAGAPGGSPDLTGVVNLSNCFRDCLTFNPASLNSWDVSAVQTFGNMFKSATLFNAIISDWDTAASISLASMFNNTAFNQDIGSWDVSSVTSCVSTFNNTPFNQDIGSWDIGEVTTCQWMFFSALDFNQDLGGWDTTKVTDMDRMFRSTSMDQDLSSWVVTALTTADTMFSSTTMSVANYEALLVGWEAQAVQNGVTFHGGSAQYNDPSAAATARAALVASHTWSITDGGPV